MKDKRKTNKLRNRSILIVIGLIIYGIILWNNGIQTNQEVVIKPGDNFTAFTQNLSSIDQLKLKIYTKTQLIDLSGIETGTYLFSGTYSRQEFIDTITQGPGQEYSSLTILEGRTSYDIDKTLTDKGLIQEGEYIAYINNPEKISGFSQYYSFLNSSLKSLEGYLYPDTYFIDTKKDIIPQLVTLQLNNFDSKIRDKYGTQIQNFSSLSEYEVVILASIVEKEEKNLNNQPTVAGILLNRVNDGTLVGADITLCYGLKLTHKECTPSLIVKEIYNKENPYNTRQNVGLTPTPIANPTASAINSVVNYTPTNYYYYLHSPTGQIYYGITLQEHNSNKKYL